MPALPDTPPRDDGLPLVQRLARRLGTRCAVCRQWSRDGVCETCLALHLQARTRCATCALPIGAGVACCGACSTQPPAFARTIAASDYAHPWDRLILDLKFHEATERARPLAHALLQAIRSGAAEVGVHAIVPMPLSPSRLRERGYNQAALIARELGARLRLAVDDLSLQRPVDTPHQADLPRAERQRNLAGAFLVDPGRRAVIAGRHLALVDDVMTTGATAQQAAAELRRAGATRVDVWVVARTP